eukprot:CAMPEP_0176391262 /NCGR_PEP_ID=MMETSP0126-20121128/39877_1 /TAXON_ID=141414 ORGANISM="Strombidinopsis acuminatum, Strain SPMC142" /NCGR_SAMPLE_ID=MMETSP0126 /ASSEMBLY_ACC=CAM_ASM_000229 /LENGTH=77 /DNA_ID=CAMNT_0017761253 /DNA_START=306 /DNA_END=539 /DNA_ORIENTATION=-
MILTGAGLSAASGIPTFRDAGGFWKTEYKGIKDPTKICTMEFFDKNPIDYWDWHFDFKKILVGKKHTPGHQAIYDYQ